MKSLAWAIGLFLFSVYLLSFSGKFHVMDELAVFTAGYNLAQRGRADINQLIWTQHWTPNPPGIWGVDGHLYTKKAPGISFITAPLIWLGQTIPGLNAVHIGLLTNTLVTALTASLLFIWLSDLSFTRSTASLAALGYGLGTIAWVYARMFWESSLLALALLAAVWALYRATYVVPTQRRWFWLLLCGLAMAIGLTLRFETAMAALFVGVYLANQRISESARQRVNEAARQRGSEAGRRRGGEHSAISHLPTPNPQPLFPLLLYLTPSFVAGLGLLYFNFIRYGSFSETGYSQEILFREPWVGAFGLLFSPGRGLFIYAPLLLLLFFGLRPAWRRLPPPYFWLITALCLSYWLFYGAWFAWGGAWGWGPRFLLPILPLLMLFVAEPLERASEEAKKRRSEEAKRRRGEEANNESSRIPHPASHIPHPASRIPHLISHIPLHVSFTWLSIGLLAGLSLLVNFLGIVVDFNEHFLRLGSNDNFVFNWAAFPPLAHWRILQEGLVDLVWLRAGPEGLSIEWPILLPALILFVLAAANLAIAYRSQREIRNEKLENLTPHASRITFHVSRFILPSVLTVILTYLTMLGTAQAALADQQAQLDLPVLETLAASARPGDTLLMPMPPFGDVQEISTRLMAYLDRSLPAYAWIDSEPRAIQADERERVWQAVQAEAWRVWLFERWLTQQDPLSPTAAYLNREAFPVQEQWFEESGKLTLYALARPRQPVIPTPLNVPFQGGLTLVDFAVLGNPLEPGDILKLRLTWQASEVQEAALGSLPGDSVIVFAQLLNGANQQVAQNDRLLIDPQNFEQSPLLPGQRVQQGYGLQLPADLAPGAYPLIVGLYQANTGQRLPRADGRSDDFLYLTTIQIANN